MGFLSLDIVKENGVTIINTDTGERIRIVVSKRHHGRTKLLFDAPRNYNILRDRVLQREEYPRQPRQYVNTDSLINRDYIGWS